MVRRLDPRLFQIASLGILLAVNIAWFDFGAQPAQSLVTIAAAIAAQALLCRLVHVPFDWRSPLVTGLSLSLLLRTHDPLRAGTHRLVLRRRQQAHRGI